MIRAPKAFRQFLVCADQSAFDMYDNDEDLLNVMYTYLEQGEATNVGWLRRGEEVIAFLEHALEGPYTDDELAWMWFTSGAEVYSLPGDIRDYLTYILGRVRVFQEQNKAGTFVPYLSPGS